LISIHGEIIKYSNIDAINLSPLKSAPHTFFDLSNNNFDYSIAEAFPAQHLEINISRYIAPIGRVNNAFGDRNFVCSCVPIEDYIEA
jgi:glycine dehydrogenase